MNKALEKGGAGEKQEAPMNKDWEEILFSVPWSRMREE